MSLMEVSCLTIHLSPKEYEGVMKIGKLLDELESINEILKVSTYPPQIKELENRRSQIRQEIY